MKRLIIGLFKLAYFLLAIIITSPIWVFIFAYDLGNGDDIDNLEKFFEKIRIF